MAISRPGTPSAGTDRMKIGAGNAASSAVHIANATKGLGGAVSKLGEEYLQKSQQALSTTVYDMNMDKAVKEFNTQQQERIEQSTDKDGNPTFGTLPDDVQSIGDSVLASRMSTILDPNASAQFARDFRNFTSGQVVRSASTARRQELDFNRSQVKSTVSATINKALVSDIDDVDRDLAGMKKSLDSYLSSGAISKQEYDTYMNSTKSTVYKAKWSESINLNAVGAKEALSADTALGLTEVERRQMLQQADAQIVDDERQKMRVQKDNERMRTTQMGAEFEQIKTAILGGKAGESDMIAAFNSGAIDQNQLNRGIQFARSEANKMQDTVTTQSSIAADIKEGNPLINYTPKQVDEYVNNQFGLIEKNIGKELSIGQKAQIVANYKAPVSAITKNIQQGILYGTPEEAAENYNAWAMLTQKNPQIVSKLDKDSQSTLAMVDSMVNGSSVPVAKAVENVRNIKESLTPEKVSELGMDFKNDVELDDMYSLANDIAGEGFMGFGKEQVQQGMETQLLNMYRTAYVATNGDTGAAEKLVTNWTKENLGTTSLGSNDTIMMYAPEKVFPQVESSVLKRIMLDETGFSEDSDIIIESDRLTNKVPGVYSWSVSTLDEDGIPGEPVRWVLDNNTINTFLATSGEAQMSKEDFEDRRKRAKAETQIKQMDKSQFYTGNL